MKRIMIIAFLAFILAGCNQATSSDVTTPVDSGAIAIQTTDGIRYVKNSLWEGCSLEYLTAKTSSRAASATISADDLTAIVETLNDAEDSNQYFVSETDEPIEESPLCNVYIAKNVGHEVVLSFLDFPRSELAGNMKYFEMDAMGRGACSVWVDKVPPYVAPPVDTRPNEIKYAIYLVNDSDGSIYYHEMALDQRPTDWTKSDDELFYFRVKCWETDILAGNIKGVHLVYGQEYIPPSTDEPVTE